ncbi:MAG: hypothetical protein GY786_11920 [Proteobacteria bacterium]|nr:hypothetical protein [Pseudomonadota bacterium]
MNNYSFRRRKKSVNSFEPNHTQVEDAIANYLNSGGKISRIEEKDLKSAPVNETKAGGNLADEYLKGV